VSDSAVLDAPVTGVRLPVVAGATFTVLSPMITIANQYGLRAFYGALLVSGVFGLLVAKPFSMILRFFPPLVTGTVIAVIGLSLIGADVGLIAGQNSTAAGYGAVSHIALAGFVVLMIVVITRVDRRHAGRGRDGRQGPLARRAGPGAAHRRSRPSSPASPTRSRTRPTPRTSASSA
jgi:xanthine/uracil permease